MRSSEKRLFALIHWFGQFLKAKELTFAFQEEAGTLTAHILFEHRLANNDVLFAQTVNLLFITAAAGKKMCSIYTIQSFHKSSHGETQQIQDCNSNSTARNVWISLLF